MPDIFVSYAHEDREHARRMADLLGQRGYSVWWDRDLAPSQNYLRTIDAALREARCVVVLWTPAAVASDYVLGEANLAREQGKLVGVLLQNVELPVPFGLIQAADLGGWDGAADHPGIRELEAGIRACLGASGPGPKPPPARRWLAWLSLAAPALIAAVAILVLWQWPLPTKLAADVVTKRIRFRLAGETPQVLFGDMALGSITVHGFREMSVPDESGRLVLHPSGVTNPATVSIHPAGAHQLLSIDGISARSTDVTLDAPESGSIGVTVRQVEVSAAGVSLSPEVQIVATACSSSRAGWPVDQQSVSFPSRVSPSDRLMEFSSGEGPLRLVLRLVPDGDDAPLKDLAGDHVDFPDPATKKMESAIVSGTLHFPDIGRSENLDAKDVLALEEARVFQVGRVDLLPAGALRVRLGGVVGRVTYGPEGNLKRERFTMLSVLAARPALASALAVVLWLLPQWWAWRRFRHAVKL